MNGTGPSPPARATEPVPVPLLVCQPYDCLFVQQRSQPKIGPPDTPTSALGYHPHKPRYPISGVKK